jgi:hypothetical protein
MHHTRKNRNLKKKTKALKKKSNKSSRKSKKSRKVHKRRIRGGYWGILETDFLAETEAIKKMKPLSERVDAYIAATKHINLACKTDKACNLNKVSHYGNRALLGKSLQKDPDYKDVSVDRQNALETKTNEWGKLVKEKMDKVDFENKSPDEQAEHVHGLMENVGFN